MSMWAQTARILCWTKGFRPSLGTRASRLHQANRHRSQVPTKGLAAVGATLLADGLTLAWTRDPSPYALLGHLRGDPVAALAKVWPSIEEWRCLPLPLHPDPNAAADARSKHRPDRAQWAELARRTRILHTNGLLPSATHTDLAPERVSNKAINSPATGPVAGRGSRGRSVHYKAQAAVEAAQPPDDVIGRSAAGKLPRSAGVTKGKKGIDGWGVDPYRLMPSEAGGESTVEPVIETLTLWGLGMLPVTVVGNRRVTRRGRIANAPESDVLVWPAWSQPPRQAWYRRLAGRLARALEERQDRSNCWQAVDRASKTTRCDGCLAQPPDRVR